MQKAIVQDIEMTRELQVGLVDISENSRRSFGEKRRDPVGIRIAQGSRTEGMDVDRDRARREAKARLRERPRHSPRIPTVIERAVGHRIAVGKDRRRLVVDDRNTDLANLLHDFRQPLITQLEPARGIVRPVHISSAPKAGLLGFDGIGDHLSDGRCGRGVEPADQEQRRVISLQDCAVTLEIRIVHRPGNRRRKAPQQ